MKREHIYILALIAMANIIVWLVLPVKNNPYLEQQLKDEKEKREFLTKENDSIKLRTSLFKKKQDSLIKVIKKSNNALWREKKAHEKLRNRRPVDPLLDSLHRAGLNRQH